MPHLSAGMPETAAHARDDQIRIVRELAHRVAEAARAPRMAAVKARWRDVNNLRKPDRAPVWFRPVGCWPELLPAADILCTDPVLRAFEYPLRQTLIKLSYDDDTPIESFWEVPARFRAEPANLWGVTIGHHASGTDGGAWAYAPPLLEETDFDRLVLPRFTFDDAATEEARQQAEEILDGILGVRVTGSSPLGATLGTAAADLRGLTGIMMDMIDEPHLMHRLMAHLRDATLAAMDAVEHSGQITPAHTGAMIESEPLCPRAPGVPATWKNCWCMANSQEFDQVSPEMWEAFCLDYQRPILERFGAVAYGCCENLTHKIDGVLSLPNLRIFVCSAWTDLRTVVERVGGRHTIMWRQKASDVVMPHTLDELRKNMERDIRLLAGCSYQIVLRELQTLNGHPDRLHAWTELAKELATRHA